ncbi:GNAT family N-acetyltransferase [Alienimonas chondri]|uniref:N-acetyltransferase domain-containing protein n=1 Tax=Alienimonas chondri TaxID=2681879 RepID=A0ABX1VBX8_9PLAN|nr:GNAT family N-acetyltransferase [Alienimonas chondri]NNJ25588.1 hypothetical protein [Alienimonas chondri]
MTAPSFILKYDRDLPREPVLALYRANDWSSADKPDALLSALANSERVVSAWANDLLIGLGNAISDGALVVYYPHLLVLPEWQGRGVGRAIAEAMQTFYGDFHQQVLLADTPAIGFYERNGFVAPPGAAAMWIYRGDDH